MSEFRISSLTQAQRTQTSPDWLAAKKKNLRSLSLSPLSPKPQLSCAAYRGSGSSEMGANKGVGRITHLSPYGPVITLR